MMIISFNFWVFSDNLDKAAMNIKQKPQSLYNSDTCIITF